MSKKYFFFDIDGTLLSETDKKIPQSCKQTLTELKKEVILSLSPPVVLTS